MVEVITGRRDDQAQEPGDQADRAAEQKKDRLKAAGWQMDLDPDKVSGRMVKSADGKYILVYSAEQGGVLYRIPKDLERSVELRDDFASVPLTQLDEGQDVLSDPSRLIIGPFIIRLRKGQRAQHNQVRGVGFCQEHY